LPILQQSEGRKSKLTSDGREPIGLRESEARLLFELSGAVIAEKVGHRVAHGGSSFLF
jgi:hypothetical protein